MRLSLLLLGPFQAKSSQDRPLELTSKKAQALLAYLAVEGARPHCREALSGLFWPDHAEHAARNSLRQALQSLRRALGDAERSPDLGRAGLGGDVCPSPLLLIDHETIQLSPQADYWLDVAALEKATQVIPKRPSAVLSPEDGQSLQSAVALYRGPFLDGFSAGSASRGDGAAFEEWMLLKREHYHRQMLLALNALVTFHEGRGAYEEALAYARRVLSLEPWQEEAVQQIMRLLALLGRRSEALAQYRQCQELLMRELGTEPAPETTSVFNSIRDETSPGPSTPPRVSTWNDDIPPAQPDCIEDGAPPLLVGREEELAKLTDYLSRVLAGEGRVVLITGEAGAGKTALAEEFARRAMVAHKDLVVVVGRCSAYSGAGNAYHPFREVVQMLMGDPEGVISSGHLRRLQAALPLTLEAVVQQGPDLVRLLASDPELVTRARACAPHGAIWLSRLEALATQAEGLGTASMQQAALCEQGARTLRTIAQRRPVILVLDDLQWSDAPSLDMLFYLGRHLPSASSPGGRILIIGAYRPVELAPTYSREPHPGAAPSTLPLAEIADEFQRQWGDIRLDLGQVEARRFVDAYLDSWPNNLGASFRDTLARHTGGNALFTVELVRAMQERGDLVRDGQGRWIEDPNLDWGRLPPRAEGAISQRIGQLTAAQQALLEAASVEGDEFYAEVLSRVLGLSEQAVIADLSGPLARQAHLVRPASLVKVGGRQLARYRFRNSLFKNYLYGRLDPATRMQLHGAVGVALEELYGKRAPPRPGQLAWHFEEAGQADQAVKYLLKTGRLEAQLGAQHEAIACYERALALMSNLPATTERSELELALQMSLADALAYALGWGAPQRRHACERAYELGQQMGWSTPALLLVLRGLADMTQTCGEFERATDLSRELLLAAERAQAPLFVASAHTLLALSFALQGDISQAWEHASPALQIRLNPPHPLTAEEMAIISPHAENAAALVLLLRGDLDQARQHTARMVSDADEHTLLMAGVVHVRAALFYALCHEERRARERAREASQIMGGADMPEFRALCDTILGWAEARAGRIRQGIERITASLGVLRESTNLLFRFVQLVLLAEAYLEAGETGQAWVIVEQALSQSEKTGAHLFDAEIWRLRGEILLQGGPDTLGGAVAAEVLSRRAERCIQAEACFRRALDIARQQGTRLWELRATVSLARLWADEGRSSEARDALAAIYATFREGFDAPDLVEAQELLKDLATQASSP